MIYLYGLTEKSESKFRPNKKRNRLYLQVYYTILKKGEGKLQIPFKKRFVTR